MQASFGSISELTDVLNSSSEQLGRLTEQVKISTSVGGGHSRAISSQLLMDAVLCQSGTENAGSRCDSAA
jgi:hypothetical protein